MPRTVFCQYEKKDTEGLDFVPYPGELGQQVFAHIGKAGWAAWLAHQTMLINENRLSPRTPKDRAFLEAELRKFLFGGEAEKPAGYVTPDPQA
ncbi:oxidative damage protection protein [Pseudoxanthomonas sp. USHLN014]|uniref:oxidative damage protection protein n=1 Tax=Pseudoxanthomonas sp. USHLN014 TaxID=3081297 RepID=UPI00301B8940